MKNEGTVNECLQPRQLQRWESSVLPQHVTEDVNSQRFKRAVTGRARIHDAGHHEEALREQFALQSGRLAVCGECEVHLCRYCERSLVSAVRAAPAITLMTIPGPWSRS